MSERLTTKQLRELDRLEREATPGPWYAVASHGEFTICSPAHGQIVQVVSFNWDRDGAFIECLRNAARSMLDELRERRAAEETK